MPIRTARVTFLNGPHKIELEKIVQSAAFEAGCQYALLALVEEQPTNPPEASLQNGIRIAGARRVLELLSILATPDDEAKPRGLPTLNYKV